MKLTFIKDNQGIASRLAGDAIEYIPWLYEWRGMTEEDRVAKGIFVHCFGQGEFEVLQLGVDVMKG